MVSLYFETIESSRYCILDFGKARKNSIEVNKDVSEASVFITSLFYQKKGLFVLAPNDNVNTFKLIPSLGHYEIGEHNFFVNKSYLYFWRKKLRLLSNIEYTSLLSTLSVPDKTS